MKQKEMFLTGVSVLFVERRNTVVGQPYQFIICRLHFRGSIAKVGEQCKVQIIIAIGQKPDFQRLDQFLDRVATSEHGRHHHQGPRCGGNAFGIIHARQQIRCHQQRYKPVDQGHSELAGRQQQQRGHHDENQARCGGPVDADQYACSQQQRE